MALTLAAAVGWNDAVLTLSGGTIRGDVAALSVDSEVMAVTGPLGSPSQTAPLVVPVSRGYNGSQPASHSQGAAVTPLYVRFSTNPGGLS
jgi:hypothetical protein